MRTASLASADVLEPRRPDPLIVVSPEDAAEAIQATGAARRVEALASADRAIRRVSEILGGLVGGRGRIGVLGAGTQWSWQDHVEVTRALPDLTLVDITSAANALRMIKSPVEIAIMQEMGRLLDQALTLFEQEARPGRLAWEVAGVIEGFLRGRGCFWGTSKYSFDHRPYLYPAPLDRRLSADDAMVYEFVYSGPPGYWYILSSLYSFRPLADGVAPRLRATEQAIEETARAAVPESTRADLARAADRAFMSARCTRRRGEAMAKERHVWDMQERARRGIEVRRQVFGDTDEAEWKRLNDEFHPEQVVEVILEVGLAAGIHKWKAREVAIRVFKDMGYKRGVNWGPPLPEGW